MDYENKHKEALERARVKYAMKYQPIHQDLVDIFPELAKSESEGERIRKALLEMVHDTTGDSLWVDYNIHKEDALAWLEKQGEKETLCDKCRKEHPSHSCQDITELGRCYIDGMNTANKVEPKFHEGDWVVDEEDNHVYQVKRVILNASNGLFSYDLTDNGYFYSTKSNYHLWAIQDAKDGDVLMSRTPFIYGKQCPYGGLNWYNNKFIKASNFIFTDSPVHPATKEQRELLFKKMKEAGYEWDAEKKEVRKIEHKIAESESERIRKTLICGMNALKDNQKKKTFAAIPIDDCIAWLEKQGNTNDTTDRAKFIQDVLIGVAVSLITWIDYKVAEGNMCLSNTECKDIIDALANYNWDKIYDYMKKKLEKQEEL